MSLHIFAATVQFLLFFGVPKKVSHHKIPFIFRETSFGQNVSELVFGVDIFDLDVWFQIDSVKKKQSRATFWVLDTCLIAGFVLSISFRSRLRCLQRCTTEIPLEKNVCWWVRNPRLTVVQPLAFSVQLVCWSWF